MVDKSSLGSAFSFGPCHRRMGAKSGCFGYNPIVVHNKKCLFCVFIIKNSVVAAIRDEVSSWFSRTPVVGFLG
jgi:hypothetical protein